MNKKNKLFLLCSFFSILCSLLHAQEEPRTLEAARLATIQYGTETEIAALIQTLKNEGADYLDNEIITLIENSRNAKILSGAFTFFAERGKNGLESRAVRVIEERDSERNETVLAAIDYLGKVKAVNALPVLQKLIEGGERRLVNPAIKAFGRISSAGDDTDTAGAANAAYLIDFYKDNSPDDESRREIVAALGAAGSAAAVEFLAGIASNSNERASLRTAALDSLAKIGDPAGLQAVLDCVSADDPNLRAAAVNALGPFSGSGVDEAILDAFRDSYYKTRSAAAQASRQRKLAAAVPYLKFRAERDEVPAVREDSIRALGAIANDEAIKVLEELFSERKNNDRVRIAAGDMLMQVQSDQYLDKLVMELDEAKQKNQTVLYNGLLKVVGTAKGSNMEAITRRLMQNSGVIERSYALDMAVNNNLTSLTEEIKVVAKDRNESLAGKARRTLEKWGVQQAAN